MLTVFKVFVVACATLAPHSDNEGGRACARFSNHMVYETIQECARHADVVRFAFEEERDYYTALYAGWDIAIGCAADTSQARRT